MVNKILNRLMNDLKPWGNHLLNNPIKLEPKMYVIKEGIYEYCVNIRITIIIIIMDNEKLENLLLTIKKNNEKRNLLTETNLGYSGKDLTEYQSAVANEIQKPTEGCYFLLENKRYL